MYFNGCIHTCASKNIKMFYFMNIYEFRIE
jgi:hypothetical protein